MENKEAPRHYHPENISDKAAVVTGGTTGIGRAIAQLLLERGARVLIYGRDEGDLRRATDELNQIGHVYGLTADQSRLEDIQRVFSEADSKLGGVDILVNNAAISKGSVFSCELEEIAYAVNVNILGYLACTREAVARMQGRGGHIVNIGSMSADLREEESEIYVATKAAIQGFSESLRKTANPKGIKVSLIEPGLVISDMSSSSPEETEQKLRDKEILKPTDIAESVHYVLTQPARCDVIRIQVRPHCQTI